ncbi:MAG TPA: hypothetical protein VMR70_00695 [Flavisolibacter sp.]|nr:hypothetical protein [Flavisolibacter sp.]
MTPYYHLSFQPNEAPVLQSFYQTLLQSGVDDLETNYFSQFGRTTKWACYSDYQLEGKKPNSVITFSFFPSGMDHMQLGGLITALAPSEIKKAKTIRPEFVSFLKASPILTFSVVLENYRFLDRSTLEELRMSLVHTLDKLADEELQWTSQNPHMAEENKTFARKVRRLIREVQENRKLVQLKNLFLVTSIGSMLATLVCNRTQAKLFGWFSDRDAIHDVEDRFAIELFNVLFIQKLHHFPHCLFVAAPASSRDEEFYQDLVKVPDFITGAIADYDRKTNQISHSKFSGLLRDFMADNRRNFFLYRIDFANGKQATSSRLFLKRTGDT